MVPLNDKPKETKKQNLTDNNRSLKEIFSSYVRHVTVYDPDVARTTIKETTIMII